MELGVSDSFILCGCIWCEVFRESNFFEGRGIDPDLPYLFTGDGDGDGRGV